MTSLQQGMMFHALYDERAVDVYTGQLVLRLAGPLDAEVLRLAGQALLDRHPTLRAAFWQDDLDEPVQVIGADVVLPWRVLDLSSLPADERDREYRRVVAAERAHRFDLSRPPLLRMTLVRLGPADHGLIIGQHHLVIDGWSAPLMVRDLLALYDSRGDASALPRVAPFRATSPGSPTGTGGRRGRRGARPCPAHRAGPGRAAGLPPGGRLPGRAWFELSEADSAAVDAVARRCGVTVNTVFQTVWAVG
ncbi:hypothetical protein K7G98_15225 [Saccharothrix sp. MB29]|nr:hypothetical protein [Saccharothrix sp. MB29]